MDEDCLEGHPDDSEFEPEGPVLQIPDVAIDTLFHLPKLFGLTTTTGDLCPSGNAGLEEMAHHVLVYQL